MKLKNSKDSYGLVTITIHWSMALLIFFLFGLGIYMTDLSYMDPWYNKGPDLHRSVGILTFILLLFRIIWVTVNIKPTLVPMAKWEEVTALVVHWGFYPLLFIIMVSGYLISTADGRGVSFFSLFEVPPLISYKEVQEEVAGMVHYYLAIFTVGLAILHGAAALKHHFLDRDETLRRMVGLRSDNSKDNSTTNEKTRDQGD